MVYLVRTFKNNILQRLLIWNKRNLESGNENEKNKWICKQRAFELVKIPDPRVSN
mgnify:CR=1 FL=1